MIRSATMTERSIDNCVRAMCRRRCVGVIAFLNEADILLRRQYEGSLWILLGMTGLFAAIVAIIVGVPRVYVITRSISVVNDLVPPSSPFCLSASLPACAGPHSATRMRP